MHALSEFNYFEEGLDMIIKTSRHIPEGDIRNYVKQCFDDVKIFIQRTFIDDVCDVRQVGHPCYLEFKPKNTCDILTHIELRSRLNVLIATEIRRCTGLDVYYNYGNFRFMNCTPSYY